MRLSFVHCLSFIVGLLLATAASGEIRVMDETAIPFTRFLSKAEFDQRFPGERMSGPEKLDSGWYVIYEHESIRYYFGPILLESTGRDYLAELTEIVEAAVARRPSIEGYRLELGYEPSVSAGSGSSGGTPSSGGDSGSPPPPPPPKQGFGIFDFFRRIFGL